MKTSKEQQQILLNQIINDFNNTEFSTTTIKNGMFVMGDIWKDLQILIEKYEIDFDIGDIVRSEEVFLLDIREFIKEWIYKEIKKQIEKRV